MSSHSVPSRRAFLKAAAFAGGTLSLAGPLAACGSSSDAATPNAATASATGPALSGSVVWADYGGPTHDSRAKVFLDPFAKATGVKVTSTVIADAVLMKMFNGGSGDYDVIQGSVADIYKHKATLVELPATSKVNDILPADVQRYALGSFGVGYAQAWLTKTFTTGPTTWADFWDFTRFPGKRGIPGEAASFDYMFEAALMADGVAPADLYPLDLDRAITKLDQLKGHTVFYTEYPQIQQLLASGSVSLIFGPTGQYAALNAAGTATSINWNQALEELNVFVIPKGAPHQQNAIALADYFADPAKQAEFSQTTHYDPGNTAALALIPADVAATLPGGSANKDKIVSVDSQARAASYDAQLKKYGDWLASAK